MRRPPIRWRSPKIPTVGRISVYAQGADYHDVVKKALKALARWLVAERTQGEDCDLKVFVDTAPVMEKPLAEAAGIGWQGKHTNLVSRQDGSWLFLGAIYTTLELEPDAPHAMRCGRCTRCLEICPTKAFPGALPARCPALHLLPHHRAQGADPGGVSRGDRQPHLWLRRLPRRLPVEPLCRFRPDPHRLPAARRARRAGARRPAPARRCGVPQAVRRLADQADRPQPHGPQRGHRRRQ